MAGLRRRRRRKKKSVEILERRVGWEVGRGRKGVVVGDFCGEGKMGTLGRRLFGVRVHKALNGG